MAALIPKPTCLSASLHRSPHVTTSPARSLAPCRLQNLRVVVSARASPTEEADPPSTTPEAQLDVAPESSEAQSGSAKKKSGRPGRPGAAKQVNKRLNSQLQAERAERTARNTQLRDMSIRQSTLLDIGRALERRTNTALARLQQEAADKAADEDQQVQLEQLVVEMDDLVERLRSKVAWLDLAKHDLPASAKKNARRNHNHMLDP